MAVAATVLLFAPFASYIPRASLAGLLILAAYRMIDVRQLLFHLRATRFDAGVVATTALAALFISVEFCIVIGVFLSFALYIPKAAQVRLTPLTTTPDGTLREKQPADLPDNRLLAFELDGELFFGTEVELAKHFSTVAKSAQGEVRVVILVLKRGKNPDAGFLSELRELHETLCARKVGLILCGVQPDLMKCLASTHLTRAIGSERIFADEANGQSVEGDAIQYAQRLFAEEASTPESVLNEPVPIQPAEK
jgi:SulP family sulfate permease